MFQQMTACNKGKWYQNNHTSACGSWKVEYFFLVVFPFFFFFWVFYVIVAECMFIDTRCTYMSYANKYLYQPFRYSYQFPYVSATSTHQGLVGTNRKAESDSDTNSSGRRTYTRASSISNHCRNVCTSDHLLCISWGHFIGMLVVFHFEFDWITI